MIKAVLLDIDNTLLDFNKSAEKTIKLLFEQQGFEYGEHTFPTFTTINDDLWSRIEKKEITKQDMYKLRWKTVFEKLGICSDGDKMEIMFRSTLSGIAEPVDNAYELLDYLYGKYQLYAATNSSFDHQIKRLTQSDMLKYFEKLFVSEKAGALKPAKEFFDYCLLEMGNITPEEIVLIGDSINADILGGYNYNIKTIWFNPSSLETPLFPHPDFTVTSLLEIKNIL